MYFLDGLRGVACLIVVLFHCLLAFSPGHPIPWYADGQLAVGVFFAMSGLVLTEAFTSSNGSVSNIIIGRFARLLIPSLLAFAVADILISALYPVEHAVAASSGGYAISKWSNHAAAAIRLGDIGAVFVGFKGASLLPIESMVDINDSVCVPLWTIHYELLGSLLVLLLVKLRHARRCWVAAVIVILGIGGFRELGLFVIGHLMQIYIRPIKHKWLSRSIGIVAGLGFISVVLLGMNNPRPAVETILSGLLPHASPLNGPRAVGGALIVLFVLSCVPVQRALQSQFARFLGRLSFSIYLVHWPIMLGLGSVISLRGGGLVEIVGACLVVTIIFAIFFERCVDVPCIRLGRVLAAPAPGRTLAQRG
jgi:peptidoglycan/LPS O-acetylase OafA/YrhL